MEGQLKIRNIVFLPFPIMLIPIVNFYANLPKPNAKQLTQLRKWFWQCALTVRYKAGTNRLVLDDLDKIREVVNGSNPFDVPVVVSTAVFESTWRINSTAAKAALCLMAQLRPRSFLTGSEVDLGSVLSSYNARQFHHIYPKGHLKSQGVAFHEANVIANICFLSASENNTIGDKAPDAYFDDIPGDQAKSIFDSAAIPVEARDGRMPFDEFIQARAANLVGVGQTLADTGSV